MFFVELLRIRTGLAWSLVGCALVIIGTAIAALACRCTSVDTSDAPLVLSEVAWAAALGGAIFASVFGGSLSYENDDHLPLTWTKPIGRTAQALGIMALDALAVVVVFVLLFAAGWVVASILGTHAIPWTSDGRSWLTYVRALAFPLAWFGLTQALTAGYQGGKCGVIIGPMWPVLEGLFALTLLPLSAPLLTTLKILNLANPINYFPFWTMDERFNVRYAFGYGISIDIIALALIAFVGIGVAAARWRRVEA
ncbi:MAG: hypothetical protein JO194_05185 [Candidatus Eremiobacteraeota bacterium]|nr:hypothetical protein [Candidatus Eremiobacteraeota bacterium]